MLLVELKLVNGQSCKAATDSFTVLVEIKQTAVIWSVFSTHEPDLKTLKTLIDRSGWCVPVLDGDKNTTGMLEPDWISSLAPKVNWCWVSEMNAPTELYLSGNTVIIME